MRETRQIEREIRKEMNSLEYKMGLPVVSGMVSDIRLRYGKYNDKINSFLDEAQKSILSNLKMFNEEQQQQQQQIPVPYYPSLPQKKIH